jgi:hypothetical protein
LASATRLPRSFCIFPFVVEFMMKNGEFAADAMPGYDQTVNTFGFGGPGGMEVSMAFDEGEIDTTGDGQADTVAYFNKRERFKDWAPFMPKYMNVVFWDLTQNFGYHRKADGTCEVYHHGETFYGPFPIRLIFTCHAYYVAWATERYIQRPDFGNRDKTDDLHELRKTIPIEVSSARGACCAHQWSTHIVKCLPATVRPSHAGGSSGKAVSVILRVWSWVRR